MGAASSRVRSVANEEPQEAAACAVISDAAAAGASQAVEAEVRRALAAAAGVEAGGGLGDAAVVDPPAARVAGVLLLVDAQRAAADGARRGIAVMERDLRPSASRFACFSQCFISDLTNVESAAASGAAAGVKAVALMAAQNAQPPAAAVGIDVQLVAAAAAAGARAGALSVRVHLAPGSNTARYTGLLGPMLGGSLPASTAIYILLRASTDLVKLFVFGGVALGVFAVSSGLMAGLLGTSPKSVRYSRLATMIAFVILWGLITFALYSLLSSIVYKGICGGVGCALMILLVRLWLRHGW